MTAASAAVIDGNIIFPGSDKPAVTVYVYAPEQARLRSALVRRDQPGFRIVVPPGRYVVFAAPSAPGAPDVYGAYTHCSGGASPQDAVNCADHSLRHVVVDARTQHGKVTVDDWYLSDTDADALDRIRGVSATPGPQPEGAPRFSEYPMATGATGPAFAPPQTWLSGLGLNHEDRAKLRDNIAAGPNFAGELTVDLARCGRHCRRVLLLDWRDGKVIAPPELGAIDDNLPCRATEAVLFRRDSRLLSVTRMRGGVIATQYFLWDPTAASLTLLAVYPRKQSEFCAIDPP
ncbi:MAG: hypothetical protein HKM03_04985 [Steroidobacteraceae bacterium]|nr:hypothetical protein [Steroidobacteraceae bacterium]